MITGIEVVGYRCFKQTYVVLPKFGILVGANGAGKTTLLDIPRIFTDCLRQRDVSHAFTQRQDRRPPRCAAPGELLFGGAGDGFILALEARIPDAASNGEVFPSHFRDKENRYARYEVHFGLSNGKHLYVRDETLFLFPEIFPPDRSEPPLASRSPGGGARCVLKRNGGEAAFFDEASHAPKEKVAKIDHAMLALPRVQFESKEDFPAASWLYDLLTREHLFYRPDPALLQTASPPGLQETPMPDASNLPHLAARLRNDPARFELWQDHVRTAIPQIERIAVREREEDHYSYFAVEYRGGYTVTSSGLSEGTLRVLALTILPYLDNLPGIVFLEEPENGIHPRAIQAVLQSLSSVYGSQILVSSHSPVVLANSELADILCARMEPDGAVSIVRGESHPQLKEWRGRIDLGALFAAGVLG